MSLQTQEKVYAGNIFLSAIWLTLLIGYVFCAHSLGELLRTPVSQKMVLLLMVGFVTVLLTAIVGFYRADKKDLEGGLAGHLLFAVLWVAVGYWIPLHFGPQ